VSRWALDVLRSALVRREAYVGPWLPEPLVGDPADRVTLDDRVGFALPVVLETLSPAERTAWVLHELFGMPFPNVARVVGRSPAAVRQLAVRARAHVAAGAPRLDVDAAEHRRTVEAFLGAATGGDLAGLLAVLEPGRGADQRRRSGRLGRPQARDRRGQGRPVPARPAARTRSSGSCRPAAPGR